MFRNKSTNYKKQSIGITMVAIAVAIASLLIAGTILAPTQSSAISQHSKSGPQFNNLNKNANDNTNTANSKSTSGGFTDTAGLKDSIRDGVSVTLEHRDQHMDQENLCYRANTCRQSNVGQNTLGNDNSVTGFADQSDNLQQSATANNTTPTPTPTPTATPTPTPTPTPIPTQCPAGTIFDVTLQAATAGVPVGSVLCLQVAGINPNALALLPNGGTLSTLSVTVAQPSVGGTCLVGFVAAAVTSGILPAQLSGTTVCVDIARA